MKKMTQSKGKCCSSSELFWSIAILILTGIVFCGSRLVFAPVPWPDGSAFYLPALELIHWPPSWRMHAQAAFVPSYDQANFNLMPALPIVLGLFSALRLDFIFSAPLMIKVISVLAQLAWSWAFWRWMRVSLSVSAIGLSLILGMAALWDPVIRWGTLVVRTETWVSLCWMMIVWTLWKERSETNRKAPELSSKSLWKVSAWLALSAYFHFEAIILVPAVALGVMPLPSGKKESALRFLKLWWKSLVQVGLKTTLFLSPWLLYVLTHFSLFLDQMEIQFFRLSVKNSWIATPHLLFHSLFLEHGSPDGMPKVFNLAKGIFWFLILFLTIRSAQLFFQYLSPSRRKQSFNHTALIFGAAFSFWSSFYLWCTKAEVWFVALCHLMFWPWIGLILLDYARAQKPRALYSLGGACAVYGVFSILGSFVQMQRIQPEYNWTVYQDWVSCIDDEIQKNVPRPNPKIWQPHVPDILVELSSRHPNYDLTRALDFNARTDLAWAFTQKIDVLLITNFFDIPQGQSSPRYHGPSRPEDLVNQEKVPFGDWSLSRLPVEQPNQWETHVCHYGPFWASIILKTEESLSDRALPNQNSHQ